MPNTSKPIKPGHITTGDVLEDLGFSPQETLEAKVKQIFVEISWLTSNGEASTRRT